MSNPRVHHFAAVACVGLLLAGCSKSPSNQPSQEAQTQASEPSGAGGESEGEPSDAQKKAALASLPAPYNGADLENGESKIAICKTCHTFNKGGPDITGPNLSGVFGRKVATKAGFAYSDSLKAQTFTWDAQHLDQWLTDPKAVAPNTKMTFAGFKDPKDRIDVIGYLKAVTSPES